MHSSWTGVQNQRLLACPLGTGLSESREPGADAKDRVQLNRALRGSIAA